MRNVGAMERGPRLLSVDPSLTCSGWACFALDGEAVLGVGKLRSLPPRVPLAERLRDLHQRIEGLFRQLEFAVGDVVVCEAPTTMRDPHAAIKVEQVRCIFEAVARANGVDVPGRINPRTIHKEVMGLRGKQLERKIIKDLAVRTAHSLYARDLGGLGFEGLQELAQHQDIVDALLLGTAAIARIRSAAQGKVPLALVFQAQGRVERGMRWPR